MPHNHGCAAIRQVTASWSASEELRPPFILARFELARRRSFAKALGAKEYRFNATA
jgi:hypothetical protein